MKKKQKTSKKSPKKKTTTSILQKSSGPLIPLSDRVVVQISNREDRTASGIYIPETAKEDKPEQGTVIAVGPGKWNEDGDKRIAMAVSVGDTVLFSKYGPDEVSVKGEKYLVIREDSILAVIR